MNHKRTKAVVTCILVFAGSLIVIAVVALGILQIRTSNILDDYSSVYKNEKYKTPIMIDGVDVIRQDVSCGYAVLEMFSSWSGHSVTEKSLYDQYGKVVTSTGNAFCKEMNKQFPEYTTTICKYLKNTELIQAAPSMQPQSHFHFLSILYFITIPDTCSWSRGRSPLCWAACRSPRWPLREWFPGCSRLCCRPRQ